jgi:putative glycosyltransferase (TIGR04372 family)
MKKLKLIFYYISSFAIMLVPSLIILILIKIFSRILLIRFGRLPSDRIGHLSIDVELYLCQLHKTQLKKKIKDFFFIANKNQICNPFLLNIWSKKIIIIERFLITPLWLLINFKTFKFFFKDHILDHRQNKHYPHFDTEYLIPNSKQNIILEKSDEEKCLALLKKNKIDVNKKFVCLHVRDNLYLKKKYPLKDFSYHDYRDFKIENFEKLCHFFETHGFLIFRMGNATKEKIRFANKNIIDYSNSFFSSDMMDIYLISKCAIFFGAESGLVSVAQCFRKPLLNILGKPLVNSTHFNTLTSFKNLHRLSDNKPLSFSEIISQNLYNVHDKEILKSKGVYFKDLTEDEIFECGVDILNYYNNKCNLNEIDKEKQKIFYNNFLNNIKSHRLDPSKAVQPTEKNLSCISPSFLKNYPTLNN